MSNKEKYSFISSNLKSKNGVDLENLIFHLKQSKINLFEFNNLLIQKFEEAKYPYDINLLAETLIENEENRTVIEKILNSKIGIWDKGNWSEKFWTFIKNNNLNIAKPNYYTLEKESTKKYDISNFLKTKKENNEIGENPLLMVDWNIVNYEEGKLIETLNKLDIKQIDYTSKNQAVSLYGKRGIDGLLNILTN